MPGYRHGGMKSVEKGRLSRRGALGLTAVLGMCFLFMSGCATDRVGIDLIEYINQGLLNTGDLEKNALQHYAAVTGQNYTTDKRVYEALKEEVIPRYERFLQLLMEIKPETDEVRRLNGMYIGGVRDLLRGFKAKMRAIEKGDEYLIREANKKIENAGEEIAKWQKELSRLSREHGVGMKK